MSNAEGSPLPVGEGQSEGYTDVPGFCKSATLEEIRKHDHVLTPGRYVGAAPQEDDGEPFAEKMARLATQWREQQAEAKRLDAEIGENLKRLGIWLETKSSLNCANAAVMSQWRISHMEERCDRPIQLVESFAGLPARHACGRERLRRRLRRSVAGTD